MTSDVPRRITQAVAACLLAVAAAGCVEQAAPTPVPGPATGSTAPDYFGTTDFIGRTVTVSGIVTRAITDTSFELDTREYGDDSLLVLCEPGRAVSVGDRVQISGNVQKFIYDEYAAEHHLADDAATYAEFTGERFLVTARAMTAGSTDAPDQRAERSSR
ncbi:hypothetical protein [Actinoplanes auranticolor]|uniref:Lipoprotein n=1 Tax=Actinoplanes auranticolor TaxID=47988 RepID=A0A919SJ50_9ACTN|nr:hypothetical protein [Actinoplanes auranticolor]GIM71918.1 hypothetical protein Aau02nite_48370 [Actinoplanes auranticolor]